MLIALLQRSWHPACMLTVSAVGLSVQVEGYNVPYGLIHVDFKSGSLKRRRKDSAAWWSENFFKPALAEQQ